MLSDLRCFSCALLALLLVGAMSVVSPAAAEPTAVAGDTGTLSVLVLDTQGKRVSGANVVLFFEGSTAGQGTTNGGGKATFGDLAPGDYGVFASKVTIVFGFPIAAFGSTNATVTAGGITGATVVLNQFAP